MVKRVWKWFADFEKEEAWLNGMSARGWGMESFFLGFYTFRECDFNEYIYRIELLEKSASHPESARYLAFMGETGAETVATWARWVYFRRPASEGDFDIYTDVESRIKHYRRIYRMLFPISMLFLSQLFLQSSRFVGLASRSDGFALFIAVLMVLYILLGIAVIKTGVGCYVKVKRLESLKKIRE